MCRGGLRGVSRKSSEGAGTAAGNGGGEAVMVFVMLMLGPWS